MKWIRHFTNASDTSEKLLRLIEGNGVRAYGEYWLLLEALGARFDGVNSKIFISVHDVKSKLRARNVKKVTEMLTLFSSHDLLTFSSEEKFLLIDCPILLKLQDKHSKYNRKRVVDGSLATTLEEEVDKEEEREEEVEIDKEQPAPKKKPSKPVKGALEIFQRSKPLTELLVTVPQETQKKWVEHYGQQYLEHEFIKAHIWLASNPDRKISAMGRFLGNWLITSSSKSPGSKNTGNESFSRATPGNPTGNPYLDELDGKTVEVG